MSAAVAAVAARVGRGLYGVACSGGADSLALADATIQAVGAAHVVVLTIDHGLQPGSDAVAARVAAWARGQGAAAVVRRVTVGPRASREAAARDARYAALTALADELGLAVVLLGHTARDQAETVLLRIVRGTGPAGLVGMPARRGVFARPLLGVRRAEVEAYAAARGLDAWSDPMNEDRAYARVRARLDLMPRLAQENPAIEDALLRLAAAAAEWADAIDAQAAAFPWPVDCSALARAPVAVRKRVIAVALESTGYRAAHLVAIDALVCAPRRGTVVLDVPGRRVVRRYDALHVEPHGTAAASPAAAPAVVVPPGHAIRTWRPGDRIRLTRLRGRSRKLSDLYGDLRVPRAARAAARVVVRIADDEITWAEYVGPAAPPA